MSRPDPPAPEALDPLIESWDAGRPLVRVYSREYGPTGFNPTASSGRFRPVYGAVVVGTIYAAEDEETALAEALLRSADHAAGYRQLYRREVSGLDIAMLQPNRDLKLVRLHGTGLTRLGLKRVDLIDSDASAYDWTARWSQALYDCPAEPDGLVWTSRQNDSARAMVLFSRARDALLPDGLPMALDCEPGLDLVREICEDSGIAFEG